MLTRRAGNGCGGLIVDNRSASLRRRNDNPHAAASMSRAWTTPRVATTFVDADSISRPPTSGLAVSARLDLSPAYCISLVPTNKASEHGAGEAVGEILSPRACHHLPVGQDLACRLGSTDSVAQEFPVQPALPSASVAVESGTGFAAVSPSASAAASTSPILQMCSRREDSLPDDSFVRSLLNVAWPRPDLRSVHVVSISDPLRPQGRYELRVSHVPRSISDSTYEMLILVLSPPSMLRLLRSEQWIVKSEAVVVKWIRSVLLAGGSTTTTKTLDLESSGTCSDCSSVRSRQRTLDDFLLKDLDLSELLPALIDHQSNKDAGSAYSILSHLTGFSLSSFSNALSILERSHVDFQAGRLVRRLSHLPSPSGKFGPALSVICPTAIIPSKAGGSMGHPGGTDSWSLAFHAMLEGILRDAEDMAITVPYHAIRRHFRRLGHYLDEVTVPRLVIIDAAHDSNLMAERTAAAVPRDGRTDHKTMLRDLLDDSDSSDGSDTEWTSATDDAAAAAPLTEIRITGLRDWSNCIFGDPLIALVFNEKPSRDFLRGFHGRPRRNRPSRDSVDSDEDEDDEEGGQFSVDCDGAAGLGLDDSGDAHIRLLLYQCYHATMAVVKEFYRPRSDSTSRELAARKRLNAVLARLNDVGSGPKRNHARPSGEMSPSKKPKTESAL